jgi:hypothetical protein
MASCYLAFLLLTSPINGVEAVVGDRTVEGEKAKIRAAIVKS